MPVLPRTVAEAILRPDRFTSLRLLLTLAVVGLLVWSCTRVASLDVRELRDYRASRSERALMPVDGPLAGVGTDGIFRTAPLRETSRLLVFVLSHSTAAQDARYWNQVLRAVNDGWGASGWAKLPIGIGLRMWGVCDDGLACARAGGVANFPVMGYLDPYHMRALALAGSRHEALLYKGAREGGMPIPITSSALAEAGEILQKAP